DRDFSTRRLLKANVHDIPSIINFPPVADCDDNDRVGLLIEDHAPISDSKTRTLAALETLHVAHAGPGKLHQTIVNVLARLGCQLEPLAGTSRRKDNRLHILISRKAISKSNPEIERSIARLPSA